jgi:predicted RNase H-like HicB family nuclease
MDYLVVIEKSDTGYSAHIPDLPGCVAAGDTIDEVKKLMKAAFWMHLAGILEDNEQVPKATTIGYYL